jgi:hypothetical protein
MNNKYERMKIIPLPMRMPKIHLMDDICRCLWTQNPLLGMVLGIFDVIVMMIDKWSDIKYFIYSEIMIKPP